LRQKRLLLLRRGVAERLFGVVRGASGHKWKEVVVEINKHEKS
jgi:hypothetical protein